MTGPLVAEQLDVGRPIDLGTYRVDRSEIIDFANRWDPQPFHLDEAAAKAGAFGDVIASGMHTLAIFHRLAVEGAYLHWDVVAGRRLREVELMVPVRAGDVLHGHLTIGAVEDRDPGRSLVTVRGGLDVAGVPVLSLMVELYVRRTRAS
jgi:acyl dehydratase